MTYPFSIPMELGEEEARLLRTSAPPAAPAADLYFAVCPVCARSTWSRTNHDGTGKTFATIHNEELCKACEQVYYQHPVIFTWVVRALQARPILNAALEKAKAEHEAAQKEKHDEHVPNRGPT